MPAKAADGTMMLHRHTVGLCLLAQLVSSSKSAVCILKVMQVYVVQVLGAEKLCLPSERLLSVLCVCAMLLVFGRIKPSRWHRTGDTPSLLNNGCDLYLYSDSSTAERACLVRVHGDCYSLRWVLCSCRAV